MVTFDVVSSVFMLETASLTRHRVCTLALRVNSPNSYSNHVRNIAGIWLFMGQRVD